MIKAESIAVGDKVLIRPDLATDQFFGDYFITKEMAALKGTLQTVAAIATEDNSFFVSELHWYNWTVDMITAVFKSEVRFK